MPPYDIELSDDAAAVLAALPVDVISCVSNHLEALADKPIELGRRAAFPYRPQGMIYEFWCDSGQETYFITVFFHYVAGQSALRVFAIGFRAYKQ